MTLQASSTSQTVWSGEDLTRGPHDAPDKAQRVQAMFAAIARSYDRNNRLHSFGRDQHWRRKAVEMAGVKPTDSVLDVACGTGDLTEAFAHSGPAEVIGIDFTEAMLEIARQKAASIQQCTPPDYFFGDAMNLDFPDQRFDIVSIAFGLRNVADPDRALREFKRVLRPGGRLVILEFSQPRSRVIRALNRVYTERIMPRTATWLARDRSGAYRYLPCSVATFLDPNALKGAIGRAGFDHIQQTPFTFGVCTCTVAHVSNKAGTPCAPPVPLVND